MHFYNERKKLEDELLLAHLLYFRVVETVAFDLFSYGRIASLYIQLYVQTGINMDGRLNQVCM